MPTVKPQVGPGMAEVALIDEARCIGCVLCLRACPYDAIVGAAGRMHTVLPEACTGCALCLPPCPVDCISMQAAPAQSAAQAHAALRRQAARAARLGAEGSAATRNAAGDSSVNPDIVQAALLRARQRLGRG